MEWGGPEVAQVAARCIAVHRPTWRSSPRSQGSERPAAGPAHHALFGEARTGCGAMARQGDHPAPG